MIDRTREIIYFAEDRLDPGWVSFVFGCTVLRARYVNAIVKLIKLELD